jgi:GNAT superfamily N-acetyltransferase
MALRETFEADDFVQSIHGRILVQSDQDEGQQVAGYVTASLLQFGNALEHGASADQIGDGISGDIAEYWELLFDLETGRWKDDLQTEFEIDRTDLLIIDCIELRPTLRGHGVGALAVERVLELFGAGCGLAACKPWPLQFTPAFASNPERLEQLKPPVTDLETSVRKLRTY